MTAAPTASAATRARRPAARNGSGGTLLGVFIGLALGLALARRRVLPDQGRKPVSAVQSGKEPRARSRRNAESRARATRPAREAAFDFYKILPGVRGAEDAGQAATERRPGTVRQDRSPKAPTKRAAQVRTEGRRKPPERFWLQAGSFASEADAENLKARLAFAGWEARSSRGRCPTRARAFAFGSAPTTTPTS